MTLSDITIIISLLDLCGVGGIGNDRGLFKPFRILDLKIKELKGMENCKVETPAGFPPRAGMCLLFCFLHVQWDFARRDLLSLFCPGITGP